jgi:hypothetical protein
MYAGGQASGFTWECGKARHAGLWNTYHACCAHGQREATRKFFEGVQSNDDEDRPDDQVRDGTQLQHAHAPLQLPRRHPHVCCWSPLCVFCDSL